MLAQCAGGAEHVARAAAAAAVAAARAAAAAALAAVAGSSTPDRREERRGGSGRERGASVRGARGGAQWFGDGGERRGSVLSGLALVARAATAAAGAARLYLQPVSRGGCCGRGAQAARQGPPRAGRWRIAVGGHLGGVPKLVRTTGCSGALVRQGTSDRDPSQASSHLTDVGPRRRGACRRPSAFVPD